MVHVYNARTTRTAMIFIIQRRVRFASAVVSLIIAFVPGLFRGEKDVVDREVKQHWLARHGFDRRWQIADGD